MKKLKPIAGSWNNQIAPVCLRRKKKSNVTVEKNVKPKIPRSKVLISRMIMLINIILATVFPLKNVILIPHPKIRVSSKETTTSAYKHGIGEIPKQFDASEAIEILQNMTRLAVRNPLIFARLKHSKGFAIDLLMDLFTPEEHSLAMKYYSLLYQASEFPAFGFMHGDLKVSTANKNSKKISLNIKCPSYKKFLRGMLCIHDGEPCSHESPLNESIFTNVSIEKFGGGFKNNIAIMSAITFYQQTMEALFLHKNWKKVFFKNGKYDRFLGFNYSREHGVHIPKQKLNRVGLNIGLIESQKYPRQIISCTTTELIFGDMLMNYMSKIIEDILIQEDKFIREPMFQNISLLAKKVFKLASNYPIFITNGAHQKTLLRNDARILHYNLTKTVQSEGQMKKNRLMSSNIPYGSSFRNLLYIVLYPRYYSHRRQYRIDHETIIEYSMLGSKYSGMNTFKGPSWWRNSGKMMKIKEMSYNKSNLWYYEIEMKYHTWFKKYVTNKTGISRHFLDLVQHNKSGAQLQLKFSKGYQRNCIYGTIKLIARMIILQTQTVSPFSIYLGYHTVQDGGNMLSFTLKQFGKSSWVVEDSYGGYIELPYDVSWESSRDGCSWILIPLLYHLQLAYNKKTLLESFEKIYDNYITSLISTENGKVHLPSAAHCHLRNFTINNTESELPQSLKRQYMQIYDDLLDNILLYNKQMADSVGAVNLPIAYFNGTSRYSRNNEFQGILYYIIYSLLCILPSMLIGSHLSWKHSPFQIGLSKMYSQQTPPKELIASVKNKTVCYEILSLTDLLNQTRCFVEMDSSHEIQTSYYSENLRLFITANWAIGVVLNLSALTIGIIYVHRVARVYSTTGFSDTPPLVAMSLDMQGISILSITQVALISMSVVPLLIGLHMPADSIYLLEKKGLSRSIFEELLITLSMSWFVGLGKTIGLSLLTVDGYSVWMFMWVSKVRHLILILVFMIRSLHPTPIDADYNSGLLKLGYSFLCSFMFGFFIILLTKVFPIVHRKNKISQSLRKIGANRARIGCLGESRHGWCISGMLMEGWELVCHEGKLSLYQKGVLLDLNGDLKFFKGSGPKFNCNRTSGRWLEVRAHEIDHLI